jgi:hypothetical protein
MWLVTKTKKICALSISASMSLFALGTRLPVHADGAELLVPPSEPIPASLFGMHIHNAGGTTAWPSVPIAEWRLWDARVSWPQIEPKEDQYRFEALDGYLSLAKEHNTDVLLPLGLSPQWASARPLEKSTYQPGYAAEPRDTEYWRDYVTRVATHCKGRIHTYEIWNEPNFKPFWTGDTDQMVTLTREASQIIHRIDPEASVVSPSATTSSGVDWLSTFLSHGGGQYVDVIGYHFYDAPHPPEDMVVLIQKVKQVMADNGAGDKPLWNTETGWPYPRPFPSDDLAAAYLARAYILNWAAGVKRLYWYAWDNHGWVSLETTEKDSQTLTSAGRAYGIIETWLVGARMDSCNEDSDHTWACQLTRDGATEWIVWNTEGTRDFSVPSSWRATNVTPLLGELHAIAGTSLQINQVPELLTAAAH